MDKIKFLEEKLIKAQETLDYIERLHSGPSQGYLEGMNQGVVMTLQSVIQFLEDGTWPSMTGL
jgi:hypothetical protein